MHRKYAERLVYVHRVVEFRKSRSFAFQFEQGMAKKLSKRGYLVLKRAKRKIQRRKFNAPARGVKVTLQEANRTILNRIEAELRAKA